MRRLTPLPVLLLTFALAACGSSGSDSPTPDNGTVDPDSIATLAPEQGVTKEQLGSALAAKFLEQDVEQACGEPALTNAAANGAFSRPDIIAWAEGDTDDGIRRAIEDALAAAGC